MPDNAVLRLLPPGSAHADIYQFTDKNGGLHFTNVNGGGRNHKKVRSEAAQPTAVSISPIRARQCRRP